jgi:choline monooxygenase
MSASQFRMDENLLKEVAKTRAGLHESRHLPGWFYTSPELYQHEVETIFMKEWLCVGRLEEFPKAGDYAAIRIAGEPILICRDTAGKMNAFRNVCRHRGVEVASGRGNLAKFTCPYHAWVYDLQGKLLNAPLATDFQGFDISTCGLPRAQIDDWGGYIFVNLDPNCQSLTDYLDEDGIREFAAFLQPENTRLSHKLEVVVPCNWKFGPENFMDMYHVGVIHKGSFGGHFPVTNFRFKLNKYGYDATYESHTMAPNGVTLFDTMPWLRGKVTDLFACTTFMRPTMNLFGRHDLIQPLVTLPLDEKSSLVTVYTQLPEEYFDTPGFEEKNKIYGDFIEFVVTEDYEMLESLQNGVASRAFVPGPMANLERAIHHLLNYYLDRLLQDDDAARSRRRDDGRNAIEEAKAKHGAACDGGYSESFQAAE